jgi:pyruvate kinase
MKDSFALTVEVRTGESLSIDGGNIVLKIEEKSGQRARIRFEFKQQTEVRKIVPGAALMARQGVK